MKLLITLVVAALISASCTMSNVELVPVNDDTGGVGISYNKPF